jgi:hypothetical protein
VTVSARLSINFAAGTIEADGSEQFVNSIYTDLKDLVVSRYSQVKIGTVPDSPAVNLEEISTDDTAEKIRKPRRKLKVAGPSCASRILVLKDEGFFGTLRSATEVGEKLREKGTAYEAKHIAASLLDLVKRGQVRRVSQSGNWAYQNP